jgi:hypothetical protein
MRSFRECPTCRALLTDDQLSVSDGRCPYCGCAIAADGGPESKDRPHPDFDFDFGGDAENPYAPPKSGRNPVLPPGVPRDLRGKVVMAFRLLFQQLPLITALVLTIWIPGQLLIEAAQVGNANPADVLSVIQLSMLVEIVFGPICTGGVITALAAHMSGEKTPYPEALRAGLHHWGRLFGARIVAQGLVMLGLLAFIIPGIILAVRFSLIDEVVVLEGAGVTVARNRSGQLTRGKESSLFLACAFAISLNLLFSITLATSLKNAGLLADPFVAFACDTVIRVFTIFFTCLLFLYYWEAREAEGGEDGEFTDLPAN